MPPAKSDNVLAWVLRIGAILNTVLLFALGAIVIPWTRWATPILLDAQSDHPKVAAAEMHVISAEEHERAVLAELKMMIGNEIRVAVKPLQDSLNDVRTAQGDLRLELEIIKTSLPPVKK